MYRRLATLVLAMTLGGACAAQPVAQAPSAAPVVASPTPTPGATLVPASTPAPTATALATPSAAPTAPRLVAVRVISDKSHSQAGYTTFSVLLAVENPTDTPIVMDRVRQARVSLGIAEGRSYTGYMTLGDFNSVVVPPDSTVCGAGLGTEVRMATPVEASFQNVPAGAHPSVLSIDGFPDTDVTSTSGKCQPRLPALGSIPFAFDLPLPEADSGTRLEVRRSRSRKVGVALGVINATVVDVAITNGSVLDPIDLSAVGFSAISRNGYVGPPTDCVDSSGSFEGWSSLVDAGGGACPGEVGPGLSTEIHLAFEKGVGPLVGLLVTFGSNQYQLVSLSK